MRFLMAIALAIASSVAPSAGTSSAGNTAATSTRIVFGVLSSPPGIFTVERNGTASLRLTRERDGGPVWSPNRSSIAFERSRVIGEDWRGDEVETVDLYVVKADGRGLRRLVRVAHQPDWSPDGRRLVFTRYFGDAVTIWTVNADGTGVRRLARGERPAWSPDGRRISFQRWTGDFSELFVMNADGTRERRLLRGPRIEGASPAWSPDGRRVAFFGAWLDYVYVVNADGRALTRLAPFMGETASPPAWSPNGRKIAFAQYLDAVNSPNNDFIYVVNASGTRPAQRLAGPNAEDPEWSPDGRQIAFVKEDENIKVMNADGARARRIMHLARFVTGMDW